MKRTKHLILAAVAAIGLATVTAAPALAGYVLSNHCEPEINR